MQRPAITPIPQAARSQYRGDGQNSRRQSYMITPLLATRPAQFRVGDEHPTNISAPHNIASHIPTNVACNSSPPLSTFEIVTLVFQRFLGTAKQT